MMTASWGPSSSFLSVCMLCYIGRGGYVVSGDAHSGQILGEFPPLRKIHLPTSAGYHISAPRAFGSVCIVDRVLSAVASVASCIWGVKRVKERFLRTRLYDVTRTSRLPFGFESETRTERSLPRPGRLDLPRAPPAPRHAHRPWAARHEDRVPRRAPRRRQHARAPPRVGLLAEDVLARRACAPG